MDIQTNIVNKVSSSGLISLDLAAFLPKEEQIVYDIKKHLYQGIILREKDFREDLKNYDWSIFHDKYVVLTCSIDAIIPNWAYMLLTLCMQPYAKEVFFGDSESLQQHLLQEAIKNIDLEKYRNQKVVVKGCGDTAISLGAYVAVTQKLGPVVASLMYGEPCSTVPLFKRKS